MTAVFRPAIALIILTLLLAACTRERPVPDIVQSMDDLPAVESPVDSGAPPVSGTGTQTETEPSGTGFDLDDPLGLDEEPQVTIEDGTPTPEEEEESRETFSYTVRPGDTLTQLAERFETDIATLRSLNALDSDVLAVGQPLEIPYVEGMTAEGAPTPTPGPYYYTVQAGDTLSGIAARFGTTQVRLLEANTLLDPNNLPVGTQILIPDYAPAAEAGQDDSPDATAGSEPGTGGDARFVHVVQPGEGLIEIAARYEVDMNEIVSANNLVNRNVLRVRQELVIPGITARDAAIRSGAVHVVQPGESLLGIALRYGVTVEEIMEFNQLLNADNISVGQELIIPRN